jgi:hypothetical protein
MVAGQETKRIFPVPEFYFLVMRLMRALYPLTYQLAVEPILFSVQGLQPLTGDQVETLASLGGAARPVKGLKTTPLNFPLTRNCVFFVSFLFFSKTFFNLYFTTLAFLL